MDTKTRRKAYKLANELLDILAAGTPAYRQKMFISILATMKILGIQNDLLVVISELGLHKESK